MRNRSCGYAICARSLEKPATKTQIRQQCTRTSERLLSIVELCMESSCYLIELENPSSTEENFRSQSSLGQYTYRC